MFLPSIPGLEKQSKGNRKIGPKITLARECERRKFTASEPNVYKWCQAGI